MDTKQHLLTALFFVALGIAVPQLQAADAGITYHLGWSQPNSHFLEIEMQLQSPDSTGVEVRIPAWRPGRYIIQNYAKNIIDFQAADATGKPLPFRKIDKGTWRIEAPASGQVIVRYKYYAHQLDAGSSFLDDTEAYINPITCFMYSPGREMQPVQLSIHKPEGWRIATALPRDSASGDFTSENYHELVDNPILISPSFRLLSFKEKGARFDMAFQGEAHLDSTKIIADVRKIVAAQIDIMQVVPFAHYLFMYHLLPYDFGHGVEHKNSTSIVMGPADFANERFYRGFLSVTSHEFFHVWNVERIRPQALYYPDYSRENYTSTLWIYEGITSYFSGVAMLRAGFTQRDKYIQGWAGTFKSMDNTYARKLTSAAMVSWDAWTKGYGNAPPNAYYSFYSAGRLLGFLLDLQIRHVTKNKKALADVMQFLYANYAQKQRGVPEDGLQHTIEAITGKSFAAFFEDYVYGTKAINYNRFLEYAGLELVKSKDEKSPPVFLGLRLQNNDGQAKIANVAPESPAFRAGLDIDDILLAFDGRRVNAENMTMLLKQYAAGDTLRVTIFHRERLRTLPVVLEKARPGKYEIEELEKANKLQKKIRVAMFGEEDSGQ